MAQISCNGCGTSMSGSQELADAPLSQYDTLCPGCQDYEIGNRDVRPNGRR